MKKLLFLLILFFISTLTSTAQTGIPVPSMSQCDDEAIAFMNDFSIPGMTMAIARKGKLVYMRAFGNANIAQNEPTQPFHLFRIASVSKPITSIAIMKLMEEGKINMSDKVFGTGSLLGNNNYFNNANIVDERTYDITVQNLLEHAGGWDQSQDCTPTPTSPYPWHAGHCDPIGFPLHVTETLGTANPVAERDLVKFLLEKTLGFAPGTSYQYSNIGYLTLGIIIEEITGMSYEDYVKTEIFEPIGICDMHLGKNLLEDKFEREAEYPPSGYQNLSVYGTGEMLPSEYGSWNLEAYDAHGGWIATASDLIRVLVSVDKFDTKPDILQAETIDIMTTPSANFSNYAKGWAVNQFNNWWHTGAIAGTASNFVRTSGEFTFAIILNKRVTGNQAGAFWAALDALPWNCISGVSSYPEHDLLLKPDQASTNLVVSAIESESVQLTWTKGDGEFRIIVAKENGPVDAFPLDGTSYEANAGFGEGPDLGNGNFVVYNGSGQSATINGLSDNSTYHFRVFEYNQGIPTGMYPLYNLCNSAISSPIGIFELSAKANIRVFPNPANAVISVLAADNIKIDRVLIYNSIGKKCLSIDGNESIINIQNLPNGIYHLVLVAENKAVGGSTFIKNQTTQ